MKPAQILITGSELLDGIIPETNSLSIIRLLAKIGIPVKKVVMVRDELGAIQSGLRVMMKTAGFIFISGGLGPTPDDLTRKAVEKTLKAEAKKTFPNPIGTAPGYMYEKGESIIFLLPGVHDELVAVLKSILRYLKGRFRLQPLSRFPLRTIGIGESHLMELLSDLEVRYYPTIFGVDLYFKTESDRRKARHRIRPYIYSIKEPLEVKIGRLLKKRGLHLSVAESCTGGMLGSLITQVSGSSRYFLGGIIAYDNRVKEKVLGIPERVLTTEGAVSLRTALLMAKGVRELLGTDFGIGITGIAGPTGGTREKPVGLVYISISGREFDYGLKYRFTGDRFRIRVRACYHALDLLRRYLEGAII